MRKAVYCRLEPFLRLLMSKYQRSPPPSPNQKEQLLHCSLIFKIFNSELAPLNGFMPLHRIHAFQGNQRILCLLTFIGNTPLKDFLQKSVFIYNHLKHALIKILQVPLSVNVHRNQPSLGLLILKLMNLMETLNCMPDSPLSVYFGFKSMILRVS